MAEPYRRILAAIREEPWAILPSYLETIVAVVEMRAAGVRRDAAEIEAAIQDGRAKGSHQAAGTSAGVAVIPVFGAMAHRISTLDDISAGTSCERTEAALRAAAADSGVAAILLDVNSPGGQVQGVTELAATIREVRAVKPVIAIANGTAASAAYWAASQADELVMTPSGQVGAIGVITYHDDLSGMAEKDGVKRTYIVSQNAAHKAEGNPFGPLSEDTASHVQERLNQIEAVFLADVAEGRRTDVADVAEHYGNGRMFLADEALELGMVDRIESMHETLTRLVAMASTGTVHTAAARGTTTRPTAATATKENDMSKTAEQTAADAAAAGAVAKVPDAAAIESELAQLREARTAAQADLAESRKERDQARRERAETRVDRDLETLKDRVNVGMRRAGLRESLVQLALLGDSATVKVAGADGKPTDATLYDARLAELKAMPVIGAGLTGELAAQDSADGGNWDTRTAAERAFDMRHGITDDKAQAIMARKSASNRADIN